MTPYLVNRLLRPSAQNASNRRKRLIEPTNDERMTPCASNLLGRFIGLLPAARRADSCIARHDACSRRRPQRQQANNGQYTMQEIVDAGHSFFGSTSGGLAKVVEAAFPEIRPAERLYSRPGRLRRLHRRPDLRRRPAQYQECRRAPALLAGSVPRSSTTAARARAS